MGIFHRYKSTIHGNYRRAYLLGGFVVGALLALYVVVRYMMGRPVESPLSYVSDAILLVLIFLLASYYRRSLPDGLVTLKELMLLGIGISAVAALVYGLVLWAFGTACPQQTVLFTTSMTGKETSLQDPQLHYWAAWWAIMAAVETLLLGAFGAFLAAIFFRTEKSEIKHREK